MKSRILNDRFWPQTDKIMSLYFVAIKSGYTDIPVKDIFVHIKTGVSGKDSSSYIAFTSKAVGLEYLSARKMTSNFRLVTLEEAQKLGFEQDMGSGTVVFDNVDQIAESLDDKSGNYLKKLIQ